MFAIKFDSVLFTDLETLSAYIAGAYGSWSQVPWFHPQAAIAESLAILNTSYYEERSGVAVYRPRSEWPVLEEEEEWDDDRDYCPMVNSCQPWAREDVCGDCPHYSL